MLNYNCDVNTLTRAGATRRFARSFKTISISNRHMYTRIFYTRFWDDAYICSLPRLQRYIFCYLLTNKEVNISGMYELSDRRICFDLDINERELTEAKERFQEDGKFVFLHGWVRIMNIEKYQSYKGQKNEIAREKELLRAPTDLITYSIDTVSKNTDSVSILREIRNQKSEIRNPITKDKVLASITELEIWKRIVGTSIRKDIPKNLSALERLRKDFKEPDLEILLGAVRMIRADHFQKRRLQSELMGFVGLEKNLEQVEAYIASIGDEKFMKKTPVIGEGTY